MQRRQYLTHPLLGIPAAAGIHGGHGALDAVAVFGGDGALVLADDASGLAHARVDLVEERALGVEVGVLVEEGHAYVVHEAYLAAAVRRIDSGEDLQQRTLACAVGGYEGDFVTLVYVETYVAEEHPVAVRLAEVLRLKETCHRCVTFRIWSYPA